MKVWHFLWYLPHHSDFGWLLQFKRPIYQLGYLPCRGTSSGRHGEDEGSLWDISILYNGFESPGYSFCLHRPTFHGWAAYWGCSSFYRPHSYESSVVLQLCSILPHQGCPHELPPATFDFYVWPSLGSILLSTSVLWCAKSQEHWYIFSFIFLDMHYQAVRTQYFQLGGAMLRVFKCCDCLLWMWFVLSSTMIKCRPFNAWWCRKIMRWLPGITGRLLRSLRIQEISFCHTMVGCIFPSHGSYGLHDLNMICTCVNGKGFHLLACRFRAGPSETWRLESCFG